MKRNLKNFNHWIAKLRKLAIEAKVKTQELDDSYREMTVKEIRKVFDKKSYTDEFENGTTPYEAFEDTIAWRDAM